MASREPMWYCHQCNAEMRPLMVPDPVCASCRSSFVEKMEDPSDDPREFHRQGPFYDGEGDDAPPGADAFLMLLQSLMDGPRSSPRHPPSPRSPPSGLTFQVRSTSGPARTIRFGGSNTLGFGGSSPGNGTSGRVPTMGEYLRRGDDLGDNGNPRGGIAGPLMAQYLMALMGREPFGDMLGRGGPEGGRMGDYVFNQEALDQIITQLMENSNAHRPVPATEEIMEKLPREVLEAGSPTLEKDCAVCKEQFSTETEDPDEQVVITLPCKHPFHESCIMPWLKSSGTCPVCRHALVPQPEHHGPNSPGGSGSPTRGGSGSPTRSRSPPTSNDSGGLFQSLFGYMGGHSGSSGSGGNSSPQHNRTGPSSRRGGADPEHDIPGGWSEN